MPTWSTSERPATSAYLTLRTRRSSSGGGNPGTADGGRPNLAGYFRTYEQEFAGEVRGYHKPIMLAGGLGNIAAAHAAKRPLGKGTLFIQLGGPGFLIGMGGGAASSMASGANIEALGDRTALYTSWIALEKSDTSRSAKRQSA